MRTALTSLIFAAGLALACGGTAAALSAGGSAIQQAAAGLTVLDQAHYYRKVGKHGIKKCWHEFGSKHHVCHTYKRWW